MGIFVYYNLLLLILLFYISYYQLYMYFLSIVNESLFQILIAIFVTH